jgi:hypothetical protein
VCSSDLTGNATIWIDGSKVYSDSLTVAWNESLTKYSNSNNAESGSFLGWINATEVAPSPTPTPTPTPAPTPTPILTNLKLYSDSSLQTPLTGITWGTLNAGTTTTRTIYVYNPNSQAVTLSMFTSGYSPTNANTYAHLTWNRDSVVLSPHTAISATLSLLLDSTAPSTAFGFTITILGVSS